MFWLFQRRQTVPNSGQIIVHDRSKTLPWQVDGNPCENKCPKENQVACSNIFLVLNLLDFFLFGVALYQGYPDESSVFYPDQRIVGPWFFLLTLSLEPYLISFLAWRFDFTHVLSIVSSIFPDVASVFKTLFESPAVKNLNSIYKIKNLCFTEN